MSTFVVTCIDKRLFPRTIELHDQYTAIDGTEPYFGRAAGCSLAYYSLGLLRIHFAPAIELGATHIHLEDHMGIADVSGCGAFYAKMASNGLYPQQTEFIDHRREMKQLVKRLKGAYDVDVTAGIYLHDADGSGTFDILHQDDDRYAAHLMLAQMS